MIAKPSDSGGGVASTIPVLTTTTDDGLSAERVLTAGNGVDFVDNGPGATLVITVDETELSHASLGDRAWTSSGHTHSGSGLAGFTVGGVATTFAIGTDVQAYDAGLASLVLADAGPGLPYSTAGNTWTRLTLAADKGIYATANNALDTFDLTVKARSVLDDSSYSAMRRTVRADPLATEMHVTKAIPFGNDIFVQGCQVTGAGSSVGPDADGYWRRFQSGAVSGNLSTLGINQSTVFPVTGLRIGFIIRSDTAYATSTRLLVGLSSGGSPGDQNSALAGTHAIFVKGNTADGDTQFKVCTNDGGGDTGSTSAGFGPTLANDSVYRITFEWTGATTCVVTVDDLDAGTTGSITVNSDMPTIALATFITVVTKTAAARFFDFGGWYAERPFKGYA